MIPTNMTTVILSLNITDDDVYESDETFDLVINSTLLPDHIFLDHPYTAILSILNDEKRMYVGSHLYNMHTLHIHTHIYVTTLSLS